MKNIVSISLILYFGIFISSFIWGGDPKEIGITTSSTFYELSFEAIDGNNISLSEFKGKNVLIVNTASRCGYTKQYNELQKLQEAYPSDLVVIGFPCNDFGSQEKGSNAEILEFCQKNFGVDFLLSEKIKIKGKECHPIFTWLTTKSLNGVSENKISWNFNKFLINKQGELVSYFPSNVKPLDEAITTLIN
tara:strand:- start:262 stop:834 length:573 start_codon:yes stop_codon:yes gene_type:complete